jgi:hypothetical protein
LFFQETKLYPGIGLVLVGICLIPLVDFLTRGTITVIDTDRQSITTRRRISGILVKEVSLVGRKVVMVRAEKRSLGVGGRTMVFYYASLDGGASAAEVFWGSSSSRVTIAIADAVSQAVSLPLKKARDVK